ncbi:MAG: DUF6044 family protein, partial [Chloroflexota bacterium]
SIVISVFPINLGRFHVLHPMLWSIMFALSLVWMVRYIRAPQSYIAIFISLQLIYVGFNHELVQNLNQPSYEAFFAEEQFAQISDFIDQPLDSYYVVTIGFHPSVALYNGFYTLNAYVSNYPLAYKNQFREIISGELDKNPELQSYFDNWGSRAYIFVDELGNDSTLYRGNGIRIEDLDLNLDVLHEMGGRYILSAVEINTETNPEYQLLEYFQHPDSAWEIYLYGF